MGLRIPLNQIKSNQYTSGGELVEKTSFKEYKGYYYVIGDKYFSGKEYNPKAIELVKSSPQTSKVSSFSGDTLKYFYSAPPAIQNMISKPQVVNGINTSASPTISENKVTNRYFIKKQNVTPVLIKEVNEDTFNNTTDPIYIKIALKYDPTQGFNKEQVDYIDKYQMPGLKTYLNTNYVPGIDD
jgi:hypothetical protein